MPSDVVVISAFRRPTFRTAVAPQYHGSEEPWDSPPFILAGAARSAGLTVEVLPLQNLFPGYVDAADSPRLLRILRQCRAKLAIFAADHYVASRSTASIYGVRIVSAMLRQLHPEIIIAMSGRLATVLRADTFRLVPDLDAVLIGEIDAQAATIIPGLMGGGSGETSHVLWRERPHAPVLSAFTPDLDEEPEPAFDTVPEVAMETFRQSRHPGAGRIPFSIRTSAGCKFRCRFCAGVPHWQSYRTKTARRVASELDALQAQLPGIARIAFLEDEVFTKEPKHVREIVGVFRDRQVVLEGVYTHSSMLTAECAAEMLGSVKRVFLGLDTVSDSTQRLMRKGQTVSTVLDAVERAQQGGMRVHLELIVGAPGDTPVTSAALLLFARSAITSGLVEDANTYIYCAHPGTEFAVNATKHGVIIEEDLEWMQESGGFPASRTTELSRAQVFTIYLMSQVLIAEARAQRRALGLAPPVAAPAAHLSALADIIQKIS